MAGVKWHKLHALVVALSRSLKPLLFSTAESTTLPSAPIVSLTVTTPSSSFRKEDLGYSGFSQLPAIFALVCAGPATPLVDGCATDVGRSLVGGFTLVTAAITLSCGGGVTFTSGGGTNGGGGATVFGGGGTGLSGGGGGGGGLISSMILVSTGCWITS